jgi:hypothetical protein
MLSPADLARAYRRNSNLVLAQADGLGHADSLLQTPWRVNCFNWIVGHLIAGRNSVLEVLGAEPVGDPKALARYVRESEPITSDGPGVIQFADLLALLSITSDRIEASVPPVTEEWLAAEIAVGERTQTRAYRIHFLYFHDTYHTGQTEILRQVAGVGDKVI